MIDLYISLTAAFANVGLGLVTILRNTRSLTYRLFFASTLSISIWALMTYFSDHADGELWLMLATRATYSLAFLSVTLMSYFSLLFPITLIKSDKSRLVFWFYMVCSIAGSILSASDLVVGHLTFRPGVTDVEAGPLYWEYLGVLLIWVLSIFVNFFRSYKNKGLSKVARSQIVIIVSGVAVSFFAAITTNGILPVLFSDWNYAKVGPLVTVFLVGSVAFAIIRRKLFDIRFVLARSVAYVLLLGTMALLYVLVSFQIGDMIFSGQTSGVAREVYNVSLALILAFTFQPLRRLFQRITNKLFYRYNYDSQVVLNQFSKVLVSELELETLLRKSQTEIYGAIHIEFGQIIVFDKGKVYSEQHHGKSAAISLSEAEIARLNQSLIVADELTSGETKTVMQNHGIRVSLVLRTHQESVGLMLLGDKLSGDIYTEQDIEVLEIAGKELAVAISNARAYSEIKAFNITLREDIKEATAQLRESNSKLRKLDEAKDEFISMASHQLRTPLTSIKGYISMALEGDAGALNEQQKKLLEEAFMSSQRMVYLIGDFLNVSRIQTGKFMIEAKPTNLATLTKEEIDQLVVTAQRRGITLNYQPPQNFPELMIDADKIRQVIMNFTDNAIYYSKPNSTINIELTNLGDSVQLKVKDTGIGVPEAERPHLFTKFFRASNARQVRPDGTGVGLFMAKKVVTAHGGSVIFETEMGKGSTFGFSLPKDTEAAIAKASQAKED